MSSTSKQIILILTLLLFSCGSKPAKDIDLTSKTSGINVLEEEELIDVDVSKGMVEKVTGRIAKLENFECIDCHDSPKKSWSMAVLIEEGEHEEIVEKFQHADAEIMDCMTCHSLNDRNNLHLLNGKKVSFDKSFKLCAQCHTNKFKDWRNGAHGKRLASWKGDKVYQNCADCHNPHFPASAYPTKKPVVDALLIRKELTHLLEDGHHSSSTKSNKSNISHESSDLFKVATFFEKKCSKCHGANGEGIEGKAKKPPINSLSDADEDDLFKKIKDGFKGDIGKMPGFGKKLSDEEIRELVKHVKTFK